MEILSVILATLLSVAILFILSKLMGNKQISQLTLFDYIVGITIGSIAAEMATELETPLRPALAMILYGLCSVLISYCTTKSNWARGFFAGKPIILMKQGKLYRDKLKKARLDVNEFLSLARIAGYFDLGQVDTAIFEHNGNISFQPVAGGRPATLEDLHLPASPEPFMVQVIVDGNVMEKELLRLGKDAVWLQRKLQEQGYQKAEEIFLASCDPQGKLTLFPMKT